eukprot:CAMPEP_0179349178 /NCGR_PEP_ID=MMETSP0797-20121207/74098_1 /TAXON_ID=47934 /ORGANISM="Dinophysis acuminata, Strain DAEP01" /LENGTH=382 /DNA_ID=CAMNT_0021064035 /DNA_START=10 /DNA_END=1157 /DNA_ORIENTATION=+
MPVLPIQQCSLKCTVKNTFIDLVPADLGEQPELNLHWMDAKTCMARFSQAAPLHVSGDRFMGFSSEAHSDGSDASGEQTGLSSPGKPAGCSVHLGIPLSVPCTAEPSPASIRESARVAVVGAAVDHEKGCTFIDLRVCLQGTSFAILGPDGTPGTVPSGIVVQPIDVKCSSAGEQSAGAAAALQRQHHHGLPPLEKQGLVQVPGDVQVPAPRAQAGGHHEGGSERQRRKLPAWTRRRPKQVPGQGGAGAVLGAGVRHGRGRSWDCPAAVTPAETVRVRGGQRAGSASSSKFKHDSLRIASYGEWALPAAVPSLVRFAHPFFGSRCSAARAVEALAPPLTPAKRWQGRSLAPRAAGHARLPLTQELYSYARTGGALQRTGDNV